MSTLRLYYAPRTRSGRPRWLLEELGVPYELVRLDLGKGEHKTPDYLKLHPHGRVPTLVEGDLVVIESVAICSYLADKFPDRGLAPALGTPERARYEQWLFYVPGTIEPLFGQKMANAAGAAEEIDAALKFVERSLGDGPFLLGERFTAADIVVGGALVWGRAMGVLGGHPALEAYVARLTAREAYRRAQS